VGCVGDGPPDSTPPRVIILTAHGKEDTRRLAKEKGAWAYVEKPYIIDQIKGILRGE